MRIPSIAVIVVTFNSQNTVGACITSLRIQGVNLSLWVIDNASTDGTLDLVAKDFKQVAIIQNHKNVGYAAANNQGIQKALQEGYDYVLISNPDVVYMPGAIKKLLHAAELDKRQHIYAPVILQADKKTIWAAGGVLDQKRYSAKLLGHSGESRIFVRDKLRDSKIRFWTSQNDKLHFISGTCMFIPAQLLKQGFRFYEPYFMYYEDVEFGVRAAHLGFSPQVVADSVVIHHEQSEHETAKKMKAYYLARNHLLFLERNAPLTIKLREFIRLPKTLFEHVRKQEYTALKGISDYYLRRFGGFVSPS